MRDRYERAFDALVKFRHSRLQAARDLYYIHSALKVEEKLREGKNLVKEMFTVPRNRRAAQSSFFVMFMQQVRHIQEGISNQYNARLTTLVYQFIVLRSQRYYVLFLFYVQIGWLLGNQGAYNFSGLRYYQLDLRIARSLYYRYLRSPKPPFNDISTHEHLFALHWIFVLDT